MPGSKIIDNITPTNATLFNNSNVFFRNNIQVGAQTLMDKGDYLDKLSKKEVISKNAKFNQTQKNTRQTGRTNSPMSNEDLDMHSLKSKIYPNFQ